MDRQSTTFVLMKILRDLSQNTNVEVREQQRRFVHDRFQRSTRTMDRCLLSSAADLGEFTSDFLEILHAIEHSKERIDKVRASLRECKNFLLLKSQEIRQLWLNTAEQNSLVRIYDNLNELSQIPSRFHFYFHRHFYLHDALLLLKTKDFVEFRTINALSQIDLQIKEERFTLEDQLCRELLDQLFERASKEILNAKNERIVATSSFRENRLARKQLDQQFEEGKLTFETEHLRLIPEKYFVVDIRNQSTESYLEVLVQSLAILFHLNETLDLIQRKFVEQFDRIVRKTTDHIFDNNFLLIHNGHSNEHLRELFQLCYEQFRSVMKNVQILFQILTLIQTKQSPFQLQQNEFRTASTTIPMEIPNLFPIELVWEAMQQVLVNLFYEYVDFNTTIKTRSNTTLDYPEERISLDFSHYLTKKCPVRPVTISRLFQFSHSAQFHSMTSFLEEQNRFFVKSSRLNQLNSYEKYVCKPNYRNITIIHDILQRIIDDIDAQYSLHPSQRFLDRKLTEFIRDHFIGRVIKDIRDSAQLSSTSNHSTEIIPMVLQKQLELSVPILQSTYLIWKSCEELSGLVKCLPLYGEEFCQAMIDLIFKHRETSHKLFDSIVEKNECPGLSIYSNEWVKDPDINRHLRTMPNFDAFLRSAKTNDNEPISETIRFRQSKETETLLINFSRDEMIIDDLCTNYKHIQLLATIHESLHWLNEKMATIFDQSINEDQQEFRLALEVFSNALKTTFHFSLDILLVLFLEIRLHCFYYLSLLFRQSHTYAFNIDPSPDENVLALNRDLTRLQETLRPLLVEEKFNFLFQGLSFVLSTTLIRSISRFSRISEWGVMKMCRNIFAIEQTLAQLGTIGDVDLTRAHRFYELISTRKADEILQIIEEFGNDYSEKDYLNLLQLQSRSSFTSEQFDLKHFEQSIEELFH